MPADRGPLSAQVILGDLESAPAVAGFFAASGFEPGPLVGTSFAISGSPARFEEVFGTEGRAAAMGTQEAELPLHGLPDELRESVDAIAVSGPPDFGPGSP